MIPRVRIGILVVVGALVLGGAAGYGIVAWAGYQASASAPSEVLTTDAAAPATGERVVFRNTASGVGYGMVASVPLRDPGGERQVTELACDRVYATNDNQMCLHIDRGVVTTFTASLLDGSGSELRTWPLPGIPSRARVSADSQLVAVTSFVTGESYGTVAFSTQTTISTTDGTDFGDLQEFTLTVGGENVTAVDRNVWGVTFSSDDNVFFATAASAGRTWLVRGDLAERTLTAVKETAECPSLSPDGTHIAYKKNLSGIHDPRWAVAVLDFATGEEIILPETRSVDDQVEWLDDSTLLYGMPRADAAGDSDIWSIAINGKSNPRVFIPHAWSPSVVRS